MLKVLESWPGEALISRRDQPTGAWIFVAIDSTRLGRPVGGTRMRVYPTPEDGVQDALLLARAMTRKWACAGVAHGGGKAVIALTQPLSDEQRKGLLLRYGELLQQLRGAFATGEDLGTTPEDMALVATQCDWVHGARGTHAIDPGPYTARGVLASLQTVAQRLWQGSLEGKHIVIQGVGDVGAPLARSLAAAGARLTLSDPDDERLTEIQGQLDASSVSVEQALSLPCDIIAPCAIGGVLGERQIAALQCQAVVGGANNPLVDEQADAARLHSRGIVYAPDFIVNAGAAIALPLLDADHPERDVLARVDNIGQTLDQVLEQSAAADTSPLVAAEQLVNERLAAAAASRSSP